MSDPREPLRRQSKIGPKYFEDEPPRVVQTSLPRRNDIGEVARIHEILEPTQLIPAPPEEMSTFEKAVRFAYGSPHNFLFDDGGKIIFPDLTAEQAMIMQRVVWQTENTHDD
jgi:hypothetical protein